MSSRDVLMSLEGGEALRKKLKQLGKGALTSALRPHIEDEAGALMTAAAVGEPVRTGKLHMKKQVVRVRLSKTVVSYAVAYLSFYAKWVHEGIFGHAKLGARYGKFKWFERAMQSFGDGYVNRTGQALWKLIEKEAKRP